MSTNITAALDAVRALVAALGPRAPGPASPPRCSLDFGEVAGAEYDAVRDTMRPVVFEHDRVNDLGETEMDATGYVGGVCLRVRTVRVATQAELIARIDKLRASVQARQEAALVEVAMADLADAAGVPEEVTQ